MFVPNSSSYAFVDLALKLGGFFDLREYCNAPLDFSLPTLNAAREPGKATKARIGMMLSFEGSSVVSGWKTFLITLCFSIIT